MLPFGIQKGNLSPQKEKILPKTKEEVQSGEKDCDVCFKALPLRKRRGKGKSPRKISKVIARTTELQVALVPKFINCSEPLLGRKSLSRRTILGSEFNRKGGGEEWGALPSQMAWFAYVIISLEFGPAIAPCVDSLCSKLGMKTQGNVLWDRHMAWSIPFPLSFILSFSLERQPLAIPGNSKHSHVANGLHMETPEFRGFKITKKK